MNEFRLIQLFRRVMMRVKNDYLTQVFNCMALQYVELSENERLATDGKSIKATVLDFEEEFSYSEFRSGAGDVSVAPVRINTVGDSDPPLNEDHQIFLFCGGFKPGYSSTTRKEFIAVSDSGAFSPF